MARGLTLECTLDNVQKKRELKFDLNMWGVFIHYAGDMLSSAVVLVMGFIIHYVDGRWVLYIDPASSLLIVGLILFTTYPLVRDCSMILLQSTPGYYPPLQRGAQGLRS